jgi:uncharacterized RDD family membrane protein YckC
MSARRNPKFETRMTNQIRNPRSEIRMIGRGRFRISSFLIALLLLVASTVTTGIAAGQAAIAPGPARQRDLLAEAGADHFWIGRVLRDPVDNSTQTLIVYRGKWSGNGDWGTLPVIPDRVVSMATSNGELMLVLANGQWEIADDTDIRSGPTGSMWETMVAIAGGEDAVWAIVRSSPASTEESEAPGATNPSTEQAGEPVEGAATQPAAPARLMVCEFANGSWTNAQPIPDGVSDDPAQMALTVVNGLPVLAWRRGDGRLCVSEMSAENQWSRPVVAPGAVGEGDFKLLTINDRSVLWVAPALPTSRPTTQSSSGAADVGGAGEVLIGNDFVRRIALAMPGKLSTDIGSQTLVAAFGNLRWIGYAGEQQIEQDYSLDAFPQSFPAAKLSVVPSPKAPVIPLTPWIGGDAVLLLLAVLAAVRQQNLPAAESSGEQRDAKPGLAPMGMRFVAGLVDLAPILAVVAILHPANAANPLANIDPQSLSVLAELSVATYVMHTLLAELICGQSIGKMVFGLRVMGSDGNPPKAWSLVIRNLLRVFDVTLLGFPLLIVFINPLHQRVGDLISGTVVVGGEAEDEENGEK